MSAIEFAENIIVTVGATGVRGDADQVSKWTSAPLFRFLRDDLPVLRGVSTVEENAHD